MNVEIKNNYNGHHVEIGGVKGITIEDCDFHGYTGTFQKEAIQLDTISNSDVFPAYEPFDDTPCDNAVIKNNKFHDLIRGLGSHSACLGVYYTNTLISGNSFYNMSGTEKFDATFDFPVSKIRKGRFPGTLVVTGPQQMQELKLR